MNTDISSQKNVSFLPLFRFSDSMILPHQPEAHGSILMPGSFTVSVEFIVKGSLHEPNSPLDLQLTHLFRFPKTSSKIESKH